MLLKAHRMQLIARKMARLEESLAGTSGELHDLREELEETTAVTGVELEALRRLDAETIAGALAPAGGGGTGRLWVAAEVLFLDGLAALGDGRTGAANRRLEKARRLYRRVGGGLELPEDAVPIDARLDRVGELLEDAG